MISHEESGMDFDPLFKNPIFTSFQIEKSDFHKKSQGLSSVEYVTIENNKVYFIEAKSSIPKQRDEFYSDLYKKFYHSLNLIVTNELKTGKFAKYILPEGFQNTFKNRKVIFILIVPRIPTKHLRSIRGEIIKQWEGLNNVLSLIWGIEIIVFNEEKARSEKWIV